MNILELGKEVFKIELEQTGKLGNTLNENFVDVVNAIYDCKGKIILSGIGKSGLIGRKIAATLMSTGTTAVFMNAAEAIHGDLGMINPEDCVIVISNSGSSEEILNIIKPIQRIGAKLIAFTGKVKSELAVNSDLVLFTGVEEEACPFDVAPTASTTALLVMGDAIAITLMTLRNFTARDFSVYHPGGALGRKLLRTVKDVMIPFDKLPLINEDDSMEVILSELTEKKMGAVFIVDKDDSKQLLGIIVDGDLKRLLKNKDKFFSYKAKEILIKNPTIVFEDENAYEALQKMENINKKITVLPVLDEDSKLAGLVHIHNLL